VHFESALCLPPPIQGKLLFKNGLTSIPKARYPKQASLSENIIPHWRL
jgi:hypothetical protein